jgi:hypothetical protein
VRAGFAVWYEQYVGCGVEPIGMEVGRLSDAIVIKFRTLCPQARPRLGIDEMDGLALLMLDAYVCWKAKYEERRSRFPRRVTLDVMETVCLFLIL